MTNNALAELNPDAKTAKRAQYEGFEFDVVAPGILKVTNGSYGPEEKDDHTYRVNVENGVPVACECPADTYHDGACKHRTAVAIREPVLEAARVGDGPQAVADGGIVVADDSEVLEPDDVDPWEGPFSEYDKYGQPTGTAYVRCRDCGREVVTGQKEHMSHREGCRFGGGAHA